MLFEKKYSHCGHVSLREVKIFRKIVDEAYDGGRFRDLVCLKKWIVRKVGGRIFSCDECHRRYEDGTILDGQIIPSVGIFPGR